MSVAREMAKYALSLSFKDLPPEIVRQTKRLVLDTLGCAVGGYSSDASRIIQELTKEVGGPEESTVIGSGKKTSCLNATLANGAMVRYLDYNDVGLVQIEGDYRLAYHPSEVIPAILSLGERQHIPGKDVITTIVLGYDLFVRFFAGVLGPSMEQRGWNADTFAAYVMPVVAGKLLGLNEDQMENAVGISGSCHAVFGILDAPAEVYTMTKNIRFPMMAYGGVLAAMLAKKGFTGPSAMIEGQGGFVEVIMKGDYSLSPLTDRKRSFSIRDTAIKSVIADYSTHGHLTATLNLVRTHDLKPEQIAEVRIKTSTRCARHTGDPVKKYPKNKETADHSSYYLTAMCIIDRQLGPDQFSPEKYSDPRVHHLIEKVVIEGRDELGITAGIVDIIDNDGKTYSCRVDYPKGHPRNPMTDEEIMTKFRNLAERHLSKGQVDRVRDAVFELDKLDDIGRLNRMLIFDQPPR